MLEKIFISHHFDSRGLELAEIVSRLVTSHGIIPVTGKRLGGDDLSSGVKSQIDRCQATIVLLTDRTAGKTNSWVKDERGYAEAKGHPIMSLIDENVEDGGMFEKKEYIKIKWDQLHKIMLDLSETITIWKDRLGVSIKLLIEPQDASEELSNDGAGFIKYRLWKRGAQQDPLNPPNWIQTRVIPEAGGATIYLKGVQSDHLIEIEARSSSNTWKSPAIDQNISVKLKRVTSL